jgi:hypothetical protein
MHARNATNESNHGLDMDDDECLPHTDIPAVVYASEAIFLIYTQPRHGLRGTDSANE